MKKRIIITFLIILILFSNITVFGTIFKADEPNPRIWETAKDWINLGKTQSKDIGDTKKVTQFNEVAGMLWGIGIFVILIAGTVVGIRYVFESAEGKAKIKQSLIPLIIGSIIILGALTIWKLSVDILAGL